MNSHEKKVIIIDNDNSVRTSLLRILHSEGYTVECHSSADSYLRCEAPSEPTCVTLDVRMPGMDGLQLQQVLSKRGTDEQIVFIPTFYAESHHLRRGKSCHSETSGCPVRACRVCGGLEVLIRGGSAENWSKYLQISHYVK